MKRICVVGGGFAGLEAVVQLDDALHGRKKVDVVLLDAEGEFTFRPLLAKAMTGAMSMRSLSVRLETALAGTRCRFAQGRVKHIDVDQRVLSLDNGEVMAFDYVLVATGSEPDFGDAQSFERGAMVLETIHDAMKIKGQVLSMFRRAVQALQGSDAVDEEELAKWLTFVVVGAGVEGVELALELTRGVREALLPRISSALAAKFRVVLVEKEDSVLYGFGELVQDEAYRALLAAGVEVILGDRALSMDENSVVLESGSEIVCENVVWAGGRGPSRWLQESGLPLTGGGYVDVGPTLEARGCPDVFAAGSCVRVYESQGRRGDVARGSMSQGATAANNIVRDLVGSSQEVYDGTTRMRLEEWVLRGRLGLVPNAGRGRRLRALFARATQQGWTLSQTPTLVKKVAILADRTEKLVRGRDWARLPLR